MGVRRAQGVEEPRVLYTYQVLFYEYLLYLYPVVPGTVVRGISHFKSALCVLASFGSCDAPVPARWHLHNLHPSLLFYKNWKMSAGSICL